MVGDCYVIWEYNLLLGLYSLRGAHFRQHRDSGAILEISLLTQALPIYSLQKNETRDGVRSILGAV